MGWMRWQNEMKIFEQMSFFLISHPLTTLKKTVEREIQVVWMWRIVYKKLTKNPFCKGYLISCQIQWPQKHTDQTQVQEWTMKWEKYHNAYDLEIYNLTLCVSRVMCQILSHVMNVKKGIYCSVTQAVMMTIMTPIYSNNFVCISLTGTPSGIAYNFSN